MRARALLALPARSFRALAFGAASDNHHRALAPNAKLELSNEARSSWYILQSHKGFRTGSANNQQPTTAHTHTYTHRHTYTYTPTHPHTHMNTHIHTHLVTGLAYANLRIRLCIYTRIYVYVCAFIHVYVCVCIPHTFMHACMRVCVCTHISIYLQTDA